MRLLLFAIFFNNYKLYSWDDQQSDSKTHEHHIFIQIVFG